jgi:PDZ domain
MKRLLTIACAAMIGAATTIPVFGQVEPPKPQSAAAPAADPDAQRAQDEVNKIKDQLKLAQDQARKAQAEQEKAQLDLQVRELQQRDVAARYMKAMTAERAGAAGGVHGYPNDRTANQVAYEKFLAATAARQGAATRKEKMAYCGVSTVEPPPVLVEQLKLTKGMGLVVDFVEPSSPAEAAGIKQYDVITKFDDQLVVNQEQFRALVWMKTLADDVKISLIRQGQPMVVNLELGQKEVDVPVAAAVDFTPQPFAATFAPNGELTIAALPGVTLANGGGALAVTNVGDQLFWADNQNTIKATVKGGRAVDLLVEDQAGKEVFKGQVETPEQRKALPPEIEAKLEKVEQKVAAKPGAVYRTAVAARTTRTRVLTSTDKDILMLARFDNGKPTFVFAFSTADGKTLFNGPVANDDQRKELPEGVANQLNGLEKNQQNAAEFGVVGGGGGGAGGPAFPAGGFNAK